MAREWWTTSETLPLGGCILLAEPNTGEKPSAIDFRYTSDGKRKAFNYEHLLWIDFSPGDVQELVQIHFSTHTVSVHGRRLEPLYEAILRREVLAVIARDERFDTEEIQVPVVTRIVPQQSTPASASSVPYQHTDDAGA